MENPLSEFANQCNFLKFKDAEHRFYINKYVGNSEITRNEDSIAQYKSKASIEIDKVRGFLKNSLNSGNVLHLYERFKELDSKKSKLVEDINRIKDLISKLETSIVALEKKK